MKNNFLYFLYFLLSINISLANEFRFETSEIEILENANLIKAKNGKAISKDKDIEITALSFEYNKDKKFLKQIMDK